MPNPKRQRDITISEPSPGTFTIDPVADIDMKNQGPGTIQWDITTYGWTFARSNGIDFKAARARARLRRLVTAALQPPAAPGRARKPAAQGSRSSERT